MKAPRKGVCLGDLTFSGVRVLTLTPAEERAVRVGTLTAYLSLLRLSLVIQMGKNAIELIERAVLEGQLAFAFGAVLQLNGHADLFR